MLLIIGWAGAEYGPGAREFLPAAVAGLCAESTLSGCLAALPAETKEKEWLLNFLSSVKRVTSIPAGVMVRAAVVSADDLVACDTFGLDEVVIIQDTADPGAAIDAVRTYRQERAGAMMRVRVWFDEAVRGGFQAQACAWKHDALIDDVGLTPFASQSPEIKGDGGVADRQPLSCEWLRSTITVTPSGEVVRCPAQLPEHGRADTAATAADVIARHASLRETAGSSPVCRSCYRLARFVGADVAVSSNEARPDMPRIAAVPQYRDFVGGDLRSFSPPEQGAAVASLMARIRALNSEGSS